MADGVALNKKVDREMKYKFAVSIISWNNDNKRTRYGGM